MPGVRRHQSGPWQSARGGGSHADENRAPDDGEAKPKSIDESHRGRREDFGFGLKPAISMRSAWDRLRAMFSMMS